MKTLIQEWRPHRSENNVWHWFYTLPNGWTAMVIDDSQMGSPKKPTRYHVAAASKDTIHTERSVEYLTLSDAKTEALKYAMKQIPTGV